MTEPASDGEIADRERTYGELERHAADGWARVAEWEAAFREGAAEAERTEGARILLADALDWDDDEIPGNDGSAAAAMTVATQRIADAKSTSAYLARLRLRRDDEIHELRAAVLGRTPMLGEGSGVAVAAALRLRADLAEMKDRVDAANSVTKNATRGHTCSELWLPCLRYGGSRAPEPGTAEHGSWKPEIFPIVDALRDVDWAGFDPSKLDDLAEVAALVLESVAPTPDGPILSEPTE